MNHSGRLRRGSRLGLRLKLILAAYAVAAALLPLAHHDLACHLKSSTHCTTCIVGSSAETAVDAAALARFVLDAAGAALPEQSAAFDSLLLHLSSGRAPPRTV